MENKEEVKISKTKKTETVKLIDQNSRQFIFDTKDAIGKTLKVSLDNSEPTEIPISDEITIWNTKALIPDSYTLHYSVV
ncbi:hypothetical protein [Runella zeae]|uniref:hypothetical protein n=1 Tax=Runella zeae TaxID=94255 RepID=UPI0003F90A37|nr:hypothetical protein [Runella zeae]